MITHHPLAIAVMAAGKGTRMKSETQAKVLHTLVGRSLIMHVLKTAFELNPVTIYPIVGHCADQVQTHVMEHPEGLPAERICWVAQTEQLGTGHAIMQLTEPLGDFKGHLIILNGDVPLLTVQTLQRLVSTHQTMKHAATLVTTQIENPTGYGRIVRQDGEFIAIVEHKEANPAQLRIKEINAGVYMFDWAALQNVLGRLENLNAKGEYYLTDVIPLLIADQQRIGTVTVDNPTEVLGINTRKELADLEAAMRHQINEQWMLTGVTIRDPDHTYIDCTVQLEADTEILPGTVLQGRVKIGNHCQIGPHTQLKNVTVGHHSTIAHSVAEEAIIGDHVTVGPFAHIRPGTVLAEKCKVGNFVELKKAHLQTGTKASHLSYLGDVSIGHHSNIGAGTITCNYDGTHKHKTVLGDQVFIGSNSTLVAPLTIENDAYIAAGSVITERVPAGSLGIGRGRQVNKEGWVARNKQHKTE